MPLDVAILASNGPPRLYASISLDAHHELMTLAQQRGLSAVLKCHDYYGPELCFTAMERDKLENELLSTLEACTPSTSDEVRGLLRVFAVARDAAEPVWVLPD